MNNLKDKFRRFMVGRYGTDELNRFILTVVLAMVICNLFIRSGPVILPDTFQFIPVFFPQCRLFGQAPACLLRFP